MMTRINLVPPAELCDQHLLAEHRELTRIPNAVAKGKYHLKGQPTEYKLGEGHVRFALVLPPEEIKKAVEAVGAWL